MRRVVRAALAAAVTLLILPADSFAQWTTQHLDTLAGTPATERSTRYSVAVDSLGRAHAIWTSGTSVVYARQEPGGWTAPIVLSQGDASYAACAISMIPGTSRPSVLLLRRAFGASVDRLVLAEWNGAGFDRRTLTVDSVAILTPALALDASGAYHVVCTVFSGGEYRIRYLTNAGGTARDALLPVGALGQFGSGATPAIAVEADGRAHVVYRGVVGGYRVHHAENDAPGGSAWTWEELVTPNLEDAGSDVKVDAFGVLRVAVSGFDCSICTRHVYVLERRPGGAWGAAVPIPHTSGLVGPVLAVGPGGGAHLAASEISGNLFTGRLYYASSRTGWASSLVIGVDHGTPSLAVDAQGAARLVCTTGPNTGVRNVLYLESVPSTAGVGSTQPGRAPAWSAAPNPFVARTVLRLAAGDPAAAARSSALVLDVAGRVVRRLAPARATGAGVEFEWDGRGTDGQVLPAGIYRVLSAGTGGSATRHALTVVKLD